MSQKGLTRINITPYIYLMPLQGHVYLKYFFMNVRNLKYILSRKALRYLTQSGEEYITKKNNTGKNVEKSFALTSVI